MLNSSNFFMAVYYGAKEALESAGFIDMSGNLIPSIIDGDIADSLLLFDEEIEADITSSSGIFSQLPAITINDSTEDVDPGGLGGMTRHTLGFEISVFGRSKSESRIMAEALANFFKNKITVYDYTISVPGASGFPASGQLIGEFPVTDITVTKPMLPVYSTIDNTRRDISFNIITFEN